ncbi:MAG TPA: hypothetical protein VJA47_00210 [archaeon]|nr:hypothetical protein [archaeon]
MPAEIVQPKQRVYVMFGTEGVVGDGARECCAASGTALYKAGLANEFLAEQVDPNPVAWKGALQNPWVDLWMVGRPLVRKAGEYLTLHWITKNRPEVLEAVRDDPLNPESYKPLNDLFNSKQDEFKQSGLWAQHDSTKDPNGFYEGGRYALQKADMKTWYGLTRPFPGAVQTLRQLARTRKFGPDGQLLAGFQPAFGTSKDEPTAFLQCKAWSNDPELMEPGEVDLLPTEHCLIAPYYFMGKETVPSRDKVDQAKAVAGLAHEAHGSVILVNDQYSQDELDGLTDAGFGIVFLEGGYAFPIEIAAMQADKRIRCATRESLVEVIGEVAKRRGLAQSSSYPVFPALTEELIPPWARSDEFRNKLLSLV